MLILSSDYQNRLRLIDGIAPFLSYTIIANGFVLRSISNVLSDILTDNDPLNSTLDMQANLLGYLDLPANTFINNTLSDGDAVVDSKSQIFGGNETDANVQLIKAFHPGGITGVPGETDVITQPDASGAIPLLKAFDDGAPQILDVYLNELFNPTVASNNGNLTQSGTPAEYLVVKFRDYLMLDTTLQEIEMQDLDSSGNPSTLLLDFKPPGFYSPVPSPAADGVNMFNSSNDLGYVFGNNLATQRVDALAANSFQTGNKQFYVQNPDGKSRYFLSGRILFSAFFTFDWHGQLVFTRWLTQTLYHYFDEPIGLDDHILGYNYGSSLCKRHLGIWSRSQ